MCNMGPETEPFTHQRKVQNIGNTYHRRTNNWQGHTRTKKNHIYEQHGLHKNLEYPVYFLVATTSGFIQVCV